MKVREAFDRAVTPQEFKVNGDPSRYAKRTLGPFVASCYVPKGGDSIVKVPNNVHVDASHPQAAEALDFIAKENRAVRRARERGTRVG